MTKDLWQALLVERLIEGRPAWERRVAQELAEALRAMLMEQGIGLSPLVVVRVHDVCESVMQVLRIEAAVDPQDEAGPVKQLENAGKARERMRKAMKEFEDVCAKQGAPVGAGLADIMKPILRETEGVLDDAMAFNAKKGKGRKK